MLVLGVCVHYGVGINGNAGDVQLELHKTFEKHIKICTENGFGDKVFVNRVRHHTIWFGDPYHISNLVVTHFSKAAFGDKENGKWS